MLAKEIEMYARSHCTEDEHNLLEHELQQYCDQHDVKLWYYRKLSDHRPTWREWKVSGPRGVILRLVEKFKNDIENDWR